MSITEDDVRQGFERALAELRSTQQIYALPAGEIWVLYFSPAPKPAQAGAYHWSFGKVHVEQMQGGAVAKIRPQVRAARAGSQVVVACCSSPFVCQIAKVNLDPLPN